MLRRLPETRSMDPLKPFNVVLMGLKKKNCTILLEGTQKTSKFRTLQEDCKGTPYRTEEVGVEGKHVEQSVCSGGSTSFIVILSDIPHTIRGNKLVINQSDLCPNEY